MILAGKRLLITGVITKDSIAFHAAEQAQREGASVLLTSFGRVRRMTERAAQRLPEPVGVLELDVNNDSDLDALTTELGERWGCVDGIVHAIAFAPEDAIGGHFLTAPADSAIQAFQTSASTESTRRGRSSADGCFCARARVLVAAPRNEPVRSRVRRTRRFRKTPQPRALPQP